MALTEDMLMAYADGELDAAGQAEVEAAMAADAGVARRIEAHRKLRASFAGVLGGVLDEPVPERLLNAAGRRPGPAPDPAPENVVELARFRTKPDAPAARALPRWLRGGAIAATVLACILAGRYWLSSAPTPPQGSGQAAVTIERDGRMVALGVLESALNDQLASSGPDGAKPVVIGVSFKSNAGPYCRTFQLNQGAGLAGLACRDPRGWTVPMAMASPGRAVTSGYRTAASETPAPVLDMVQAMISGDPLDAKAEAAAKAADWRP